jgi:hypothetical protein
VDRASKTLIAYTMNFKASDLVIKFDSNERMVLKAQ